MIALREVRRGLLQPCDEDCSISRFPVSFTSRTASSLWKSDDSH